jgi:group II intron reverse transcriptase/maturase
MYLEPLFHKDSYGYRPGKSAKQAVAVTRKRCWNYDWVVEFDIKGAFDNLDHDLLMKAVRKHVSDQWILLYVERWLKAPFQDGEGKQKPRTKGTPQGGVISPLLMNLFMQYAFDVWMWSNFPQCPFVRYADDAVIHCRNKMEAKEVISAVENRLNECKLEMHPETSKVIYCKDSGRLGNHQNIQFTFLGFTFRPRESVNYKKVLFTSFLQVFSPEAINECD